MYRIYRPFFVLLVLFTASACSDSGAQEESSSTSVTSTGGGEDQGCISEDGRSRRVGAVWAQGCERCQCEESGAVVCEVVGRCGETSGGDDVGVDAEPDVEVDIEEDVEVDVEDDAVDVGDDVEVDAEPDAEPDVEEERCEDRDLDGFFTCIDPAYPDRPQEVDCDDRRFGAQPGGVEFPDNSYDDDCDGEVDEVVEACPCELGGSRTGVQLAQAMDVCAEFIETASTTGAVGQVAVVEQFSESIDPLASECMIAMSSGRAIVGNTLGSVQPGTGFGNVATDPNPRGPEEDVFDLARVRLVLNPPPNAQSFRFSFMFLSSEWPEFLCNAYNDTFYAVLEAANVEQGRPTNVSYDRDGNEVTVNVAFFEQPEEWTVPLEDTAFGQSDFAGCPFSVDPSCTLPEYCAETNNFGRVGSGSGWLTTQVPVDPAQGAVTITFSVHDEGDDILDSVILLDDFRWQPFRASISTVKE